MVWDNTTVSTYRIVGPIETETRWPDIWTARDAVLTTSQRPEPLGTSLDIRPRYARASDLLHGDAGAPGGGGGNGDQPPDPDQPGKKKKDPPSTKKKKVTLVDLVEVVTRSAEGVVEGAGYSSSKLKTTVTRSDQNGGAYKQFVNLKKDLEGQAKRHPEYENYIEFRARVVCEGVPLSGHPVKFSYEMTDGPKRPAKLAGHGFSGGKTIKAQTDGEGWTSVVRFTLSNYAGDQFKITAEADEDAGNIMRTAPYEVWRKFWYQISRAKDHVIATPTASITAFNAVCADMLVTPEVEFTKASAPANSFYPGYMVRIGRGDTEESVIGRHNREGFYKLFKGDDPATPVKGHLIICQHQWDNGDNNGDFRSELLTTTVTSNPSQELTLNLGGSWNAGILKPAMAGDLVIAGSWSGDGRTGALTDANIIIEKARKALNVVRVQLPADAPDPTVTAVEVKLKLAFGKFYAGESADHQMLIVHRGDAVAFTGVVSHEFGHGFGQTHRPGKQPAPLPTHPKQYDDEHGGIGSHCSTAATLVDDTEYPKKRYEGGTCNMFHQSNPTGGTQLFCNDCDPYLRLHDFSNLKG